MFTEIILHKPYSTTDRIYGMFTEIILHNPTVQQLGYMVCLLR